MHALELANDVNSHEECEDACFLNRLPRQREIRHNTEWIAEDHATLGTSVT